MMSRHRSQRELWPQRRVLQRQPAAGAPVWGGPFRPEDAAQTGGGPAFRTATCPVCESPVAVEGLCMNCWEVC
jgi:hypothetical protein